MNIDKPKKTKDYQKGKIYIIRNDINDLTYIGSTCQLLCQRMSEHRLSVNKEKCKNTKLSKLIATLGKEHFYIELLEEYPCENSIQLQKREGELIRDLKPALNQIIAGRTIEEYRVECADKIKQTKAISDKKYAERNKERIKEYQNKYYLNNRQRILENVKNYTEEQKEEKRRRDRERYQRKKAEKQSLIEDLD